MRSKFVLTEIAVILSLDFVGLAVAIAFARWTISRAPGGVEARRLVNAAARASEAFLWREGRMAAVGTGIALALVLAVNTVFLVRRAAGFTPSAALWAALGTLLGGALTLGVGYVAASVGLRGTLRTIRAAQGSLDQAAMLAVRTSGVAALAADALGAAAVTGLFGLVFLLGGGGGQLGAGAASALLDRAAATLPGFALGSVAVALVLGVGGAAYHVSTSIGGLTEDNVSAGDPRNPGFVAGLVGEHVGLGARRTVDMFAATTLANVATVMVGVAAFRQYASALGTRAWALVTLPLLVRGIGVIASAFGLMTARASETGRATDALWRGQITAAVLAAGGLAGAALWLVGSPAAGWFVGAGALGLSLGVAVGHAARTRLDRRLKPMQELMEATLAGRAVTLARGTALGADAIWVPTLLLSVTLGGAFQLGERSHLPGGGLLATAPALAGLVATSAYMLAVGLFGPVASGALTIAALDPEELRPEVRRRVTLLDDAGFEGGAVAEAFFIVLGCAAALIAGLSITLGAPSDVGEALSVTRPAVIGSGALGAALVLSLSGRALDVAGRATRGGLMEIERQFRGFPRDGGALVLPAGYTPSYRAVIDLTGRLSLEGVLLPVAVGLLGPAALGFGLRLLYTTAGLAKEGLTCFVVVASATGLGTALSANGTRAVLTSAYRASRARGVSPGFEASLAGHTLGSFMGGASAPATHLFVKASAAAALLVAPLLSLL
ncbi:MAG TPA: sodium/proton-translocating pyrophosphatase [Polyangiaceae bacterium]